MRLLVLVLLAATVVAGCVSNDPDAWHSLRGFRAEFRLDGQDALWSVEFNGLASVADVDGTMLVGHRLDYRVEDRHTTWVLDQEMRVIAEVIHCFPSNSHCDRASEISWARRGDLAPFGIGIPFMLSQQGRVTSFLGDVERIVPVEGRLGRELELMVAAPYQGGMAHTWNGSLHYSPGTLLPSIHGRTTVSYVDLGPLPVVDTRLMPRPLTDKATGDTVPGADRPLHDWEVSMADLVAVARREAADAACVIIADITHVQNKSAGPLPVRTDALLGQVLVVLGRETGGAWALRLEVVEAAWTSEVRIDVVDREATPASTRCEDHTLLPPPVLALGEAVHRAHSTLERVRGIPRITWDSADESWNGRDPEAGWQFWRISMTPDHASDLHGTFYERYHVEYRAWDSGWNSIFMHPDDIPYDALPPESSP